MILIITLRKEVIDEATAHELYEQVKIKIADYPDIKVSGQISVKLPDTT